MDQNQNLQLARSLPRNLRLKGARTSRLRTPGAGFFSYSVPPWIRGEYVASKGKSTLTVSARSAQLTISRVGVEKVRDRNVLLAAIIAAIKFFHSPQLRGSFHSR